MFEEPFKSTKANGYYIPIDKNKTKVRWISVPELRQAWGAKLKGYGITDDDIANALKVEKLDLGRPKSRKKLKNNDYDLSARMMFAESEFYKELVAKKAKRKKAELKKTESREYESKEDDRTPSKSGPEKAMAARVTPSNFLSIHCKGAQRFFTQHTEDKNKVLYITRNTKFRKKWKAFIKGRIRERKSVSHEDFADAIKNAKLGDARSLLRSQLKKKSYDLDNKKMI